MAAKAQNPDALRSAAAKWFEDLDDRGVFITDDRFIVRRWNHWLAAQTGRRAEDIVGRSLFDLFPDIVERGLDASYRDALSGEVRILSQRLHKYLIPITRSFHGAGLTEMAQSARIEPLRDDRSIIGTITLVEDVTERVISERELRNQISASDQARQMAEEASRLKDEFLATLSHEIRTPLNAVIGWTRILQTQPSVRSRTHALEVIERNAMSQMRLVEDLLDMARIISGKLRLKIDAVSLGDVAQAAIDVVAPGAAAKKVAIEAVLPPALPTVSGDSERLQQVVWNLLSNAIKFTPKDGSVLVQVKRESSAVEISVSDTGIGIQPEFLPLVFERFRQVDASASRLHGGLGLGLAIVKHLVELHGGTVSVTSEGPDQGATFVVQLPLSAAQSAVELSALTQAGGEASDLIDFLAIDLAGTRVVAVDDDTDAQELIRRVLSECAAVVFTAGSAEEALRLVEAEHPDVLVSDIGMPDVDGFELMRRLRLMGTERGGDVPVIALTAFARPEDRSRALQAGFSAHISKPIEPSVLVASVASVSGHPPLRR
jgi:signal transduction histidine kinase/ActR/RegA family two-component response regulator